MEIDAVSANPVTLAQGVSEAKTTQAVQTAQVQLSKKQSDGEAEVAKQLIEAADGRKNLAIA